MEHDHLEEELFAAALSLPVDERERYLARACENAPSLQAWVTSLIRVVDSSISSKNRQFIARAKAMGDQIDNYRLVREIGEGGCGVVYLAEQVAPVRREVALKIIRLGMDGDDVLARFEAERQVLAFMDHPSIAKVLDAGATGSGRPYFVMELVRGIKITDYCNQVRLTVKERVELFMQVCLAIQHAHHKGIIHRDIKPSNVLVTLVDGAPVAKVIDFGIAKATQGRLTEETLRTAMEQFVGTPAYVSPEQTEPGGVRVDTRSDVYSLGVLLYELLTYCRPFDASRTSLTAFATLRDRIRAEDPVRPSIRVANADRLEEIAKLYRVSANKLIQQIGGDLDWIVLRCLEKEPVQRYQAANELWNDLRQHLRHEPIAARPRGTAYALGKLVRRNRTKVAVTAIILLILTFGALTTTYLSVQLMNAHRLANDMNGLVRETMMTRRGAYEPTDQTYVYEDEGIGGAIYESGQIRGRRFSNDPLSEAAVREVLGSAYMAADRPHFAAEQFRQALTVYRAEVGLADSRTLAITGALARALSLQGRYSEAETEAATALSHVNRTRGVSDPTRIAFTTALAFYYLKLSKYDAARKLLEPYLSLERKMGLVSKLEELESAARLASSTTNKWPPDYRTPEFQVLEIMAVLAPIYASDGEEVRAERFARTIVAIRRLRWGHSSAHTNQSLRLLADVYASIGKFGLAADALVQSRAVDRMFYVSPMDRRILGYYSCSIGDHPGNDPARPWGAENIIDHSHLLNQRDRLEDSVGYWECDRALRVPMEPL
jgi:eukaryotic-like serine/threonine-protein kinase